MSSGIWALIGVSFVLVAGVLLMVRSATSPERRPSTETFNNVGPDEPREIPAGHYMITRTTILDPKSEDYPQVPR